AGRHGDLALGGPGRRGRRGVDHRSRRSGRGRPPARAGRGGRRRPGAARPGADRGRVRSRREPDPAHGGDGLIRPAGTQDLPFLRDMLRHAYYARWGTEADVPLERYVAGWGRRGDNALVAIDEFQPVGAAWYRLFEQDEPGYGFVDEETPELTIAIVPSKRGRGLGEELLGSLLDAARKDGFARIIFSVVPDNPAIHLYEHHGFAKVGERAGASVMLATLD